MARDTMVPTLVDAEIDTPVERDGLDRLNVSKSVMREVPKPVLNAEAPWEVFGSSAYLDHNYSRLRDDDRQIAEKIRDYFSQAGVSGGRGVDVGAGTNLYPALAMLPFCRELELWDWAEPNVEWLAKQVADYGENWDAFWAIYQKAPAYADMADPRSMFSNRTTVRRRSVLEASDTRWDMGTMFFVACSLSTDRHEFDRAVNCFVGSLNEGAPFAAAFMINSDGYEVDGVFFPAVKIYEDDVVRSLASIAYDVAIHEIVTDIPLRDGVGMLLATGRAAGRP